MTQNELDLIYNFLSTKLSFFSYAVYFGNLPDQLKFEICTDFYLNLLTVEAVLLQISMNSSPLPPAQKEDLLFSLDFFSRKEAEMAGIPGWDRDFKPLLSSIKTQIESL
jgi:hypothetical protein